MSKTNKTDKAVQTRDWERQICDMVDQMIEDPTGYGETLERMLELVEDLVVNAYMRGKQNASTQD